MRNFTTAQAFPLHPPRYFFPGAIMAFTLNPLPFPKDSLSPTMSAHTLEQHHEKHHAAYVKKLNELIEGKFEGQNLEAIIRATAKSAGEGKDRKIFNNAAQVWNHDFFWQSIAPNGGGAPPAPVLKRIEYAFGSVDNFRDKFVDAAVDQFGSGWAWLVSKSGALSITTTHDADNPLTTNARALWTCDVWEHAYYLDYQHDRARFVKAVMENLINWQFVGKQLVEAERQADKRKVG
jgi:Fe-Mn family superoxide dismutase